MSKTYSEEEDKAEAKGKKRSGRPEKEAVWRGQKKLFYCFEAAMASILKKRGFHTLSLISNWEKIVGDRLAAISLPVSVKFPITKKRIKEGGTLECGMKNPAYVSELSMQKGIIAQKINIYFGYNAISDIRFLRFSHIEHNYQKVSRFHSLDRGGMSRRIVVSIDEMRNIKDNVNEIEDEGIMAEMLKLADAIFSCE